MGVGVFSPLSISSGTLNRFAQVGPAKLYGACLEFSAISWEIWGQRRVFHRVFRENLGLGWFGAICWKATKEYLNQRGTKIRVFRECFRTPFLPPFFPHFSPLFPLQALCPLAPLLPSSPPPSPPLFGSRKSPI